MRRLAVSVLCLLILTGVSAPASAKRVALVIGNDAYENVDDLRKAVNDARAVGAALESIGFEVLKAENVSRREMNSQLQSFAGKLEAGDEALFFFAGHGVGIEGRNFLLPVDAPDAGPGQEDFVEAEAVSAERVLDTIRRRGARVAILVLDACRDNPFRTEGTRSLGGSRGLARMDASKGTFIIYSADVGQTALDRLSNSDADPNSVFTRNLVPMLKRPGLSLPQMARDLRAEVEKLALGVRHDQRPAYYDGITGAFFFAGEAGEAVAKEDAPIAAAPAAPVAAPAAPQPDSSVEVAFWNSVQSSDSAEAIQEYLARFPSGAFAGLARIRLKALEQKQAALPPQAAPKVEEAAEPRDAVAMNDLGDKYRDGRGVAKDDGEAARWYRKAADLGHAGAMFRLGAMYQYGFGVGRNFGEALRWYRKAADLGHAGAMFILGNRYRDGTGVAKDDGEAVRWYRKAADLGNADAKDRLKALEQKQAALPPQAAPKVEAAAEPRDADAMKNLGDKYREGRGVAKDDGEALRWYRKAADLGHARAMNGVANMYLYGSGGVAKDDGEALRWYRKAADLGDTYAMNNLGAMYKDGNGVAKDDGEALRWYRKAADLGEAVAMYNLGNRYLYGEGVAQDYGEAMRWYRKAADLGEANAMNNLGTMYQHGRGVAKDEGEANRWYAKAAEAAAQ